MADLSTPQDVIALEEAALAGLIAGLMAGDALFAQLHPNAAISLRIRAGKWTDEVHVEDERKINFSKVKTIKLKL